MHVHQDIHRHDGPSTGTPLHTERQVKKALVLTVLVMAAQIVGGTVLNSMALLANGWHMSSHALILGLSLVAYAIARRHASDARFAFGPWKIEVLGGYTSALLMFCIAISMIFESVQRLVTPEPIHVREAMIITVIGLAANLVCAWWLRDQHDHAASGAHAHEATAHRHPAAGGKDLNLRAAYLHVLSDATTSMLALFALGAGTLLNLAWLDPAVGIIGALIVASWALKLLGKTAGILLDADPDGPLAGEIRQLVHDEACNASIHKMQVWRVGRSHHACSICLAAQGEVDINNLKALLLQNQRIKFASIELVPAL
ncbi:cation diffusion facilitator family transporter [Pseudoxanthomonas sp. GM95]|uniref:CDF family Co(II)/Ni(II) efflux transporter DmeF n=1 Tax=Pseudoxanthomonas sp. GM95 TaxID=1881043 RepID=UPI0008B74CB8|nr:CDF family Co(II)/Ni(II) efflux transporter DmeF [Pseudoxanthomonas sp. GM95]SEM52383.1 cation diffusion facilitator family transporter [Pseudoxanthomonas sp. GM95]